MENLYCVTADFGKGKTRFLLEMGKIATEHGYSVNGFIQKRKEENEEIVYYFYNVQTKEQLVGCRAQKLGSFSFNHENFETAREWINSTYDHSDLLLMDEFGNLEANGKGHSSTLFDCIRKTQKTKQSPRFLLIALRKNRIEDLVKIFGIKPEHIIDLSQSNHIGLSAADVKTSSSCPNPCSSHYNKQRYPESKFDIDNQLYYKDHPFVQLLLNRLHQYTH